MVCVGVSHQTSPVEVRELLNVDLERQQNLLGRVAASRELEGLAILATCNRVEFYASVSPLAIEDAADVLISFLARAGYPILDHRHRFVSFHDYDAAMHLARVAAGLESVVLGEAQVLGQVARAGLQSDEAGALDAALQSMFRFASKAGKRARNETDINKNPVSVSSVAVRMAERFLGSLEGKNVAIIGIGEMGRLAIKAVRTRPVNTLTLVNRSIDRAAIFGQQYGIDVASIDSLPEVIAGADMVFSATGCPHVLVTTDMIKAAMQGRASRPLLLIDIAVPHDIDLESNEVPNVTLLNVDTLLQEVDLSLTKRRREVPAVESILSDEVARFATWLQELKVEPLISDLRRQAESIRIGEVQRFLKTMPNIDGVTQEQVELLSHALVQKLLHHPTVRLREEAADGDTDSMAETVRNLFSL